MLSVDSSRPGDFLMLRDSMVKFKGTNVSEIEICGSGMRPLLMYLNRQLIKILEDLGVPAQPFLDLQLDELKRLRGMSRSPLRVAKFLEKENIPKHLKIPWLITTLESHGLKYSDDTFLRKAVELAMVIRLRELKYRARIHVVGGVTLYGIMDETGFLKEGEIFCRMEAEDYGRAVLVRPKVLITRSPALHPGDVQLVEAVDVPESSPLQKLHNCIVFSQHGDRDLPSTLSGGDLDGDLYNIIWDERLTAIRTAQPAEYPRVPPKLLDREVKKDDIVDFFLTFMQQDQLGRIANNHLILADQREDGVFDPGCLTLAELHSTAVDFSKTGIPVRLDSVYVMHRLPADLETRLT
jgi:RNA dependent RNA polymerase